MKRKDIEKIMRVQRAAIGWVPSLGGISREETLEATTTNIARLKKKRRYDICLINYVGETEGGRKHWH